MKKLIINILGGLIVCLSTSLVFAASSWRCGDKMVSVGDTKGIVVAQCGNPASSDTVAYKKKRSATDQQEIMVDELTYIVSDRLVYVLTFEKGLLIDIKSHIRN